MHRGKKQNLKQLSSKYQNGETDKVRNRKLDGNEEKLAGSPDKSGLNRSQQNGVNVDVSSSTEVGLVKSYCSVIGVLKIVVLVIVVPPLLNYASLQRESASLYPHGEMHAGPQGDKLFINCSGKGLPVVLMDAPGGYSSDVWYLVQAKIAKLTKVCVYDRAGLGFSERVAPSFHGNKDNNMSFEVQNVKYEQLRPTTENMVADIHHLIKTVLNDTSNVLLVGGGLGAINALFYAHFYENVFGMVLINPFHKNMFTNKDWDIFWYQHFVPSLQMEQLLAMFGINRLGIITGLYKPSILEEGCFDYKTVIKIKHLSCKSQHLSAGVMEQYYINESLAQLVILQKMKSFPKNVHVRLISSRNFSNSLPQMLNELWFKSQELFATELFPKSDKSIVDGDFNAVYFKHADVIVKRVKKMVNKFKKSVKQSANI